MKYFLLFLYGLAFFNLGVIIWIKNSNLEDNKVIKAFWHLAAFGFIHGIYAWMDMFRLFFPVSHNYLVLQVILNAFSFATLLEFSLFLFSIKKNISLKVKLIPAILIIVWLLINIVNDYAFLALEQFTNNISPFDAFFHNSYNFAELTLRYLLAFPATFLTAFSIIRYRNEISQIKKYANYLLFIGFCFYMYGILAIFTPAYNIFPATILNYTNFEISFGFSIHLLRSILAIIICYKFYHALHIFNRFERKKLKSKIEETSKVLKLTEDKYHQLAEASNDAILITDLETGIILDTNLEAENIFGRSKSELIGMLQQDLYPTDQRENYIKLFEDRMDKEKMPLNYFFVIQPDGQKIPVDIRTNVINSCDGKLMQGIFIDISERIKTQKNLENNYFQQKIINKVLQIPLKNNNIRELLTVFLNEIFQIPWISEVPKCVIFLKDDDEDFLSLVASRGSTIRSLKTCKRISYDFCLCGQAARTRKTIFSSCEVSHTGHSDNQHKHYIVPIQSEDSLIGILNFYLIGNHQFSHSEISFLETLTHSLAAMIVQKKTDAKVKSLSNDLIISQEEERKKLAEDIHDSIIQNISVANLAFKSFEQNPQKFKYKFAQGLEFLMNANRELRDICEGLYPSNLKNLGLSTSINWLAKNYLVKNKIEVDLKINIMEKIVSEIEIQIYRMVNEIFSNILKHSKARKVLFSLESKSNSIILSISDNGIGFYKKDETQKKSKFGLINIQQRVQSIEGRCKLITAPGKGTKYEIILNNGK